MSTKEVKRREHAELSVNYLEGRIGKMNNDVGTMLTIEAALFALLQFSAGSKDNPSSILGSIFVFFLAIYILWIIMELLLTLKPVSSFFRKKATNKNKKAGDKDLFLIWPTDKSVPNKKHFKDKYLNGTEENWAEEITSTIRILHKLLINKYKHWNQAQLLIRIQIPLVAFYLVYRLFETTILN
ncbi:MAG: hypothetical protein AAF611_16725 [Bacteroidota bacterium]